MQLLTYCLFFPIYIIWLAVCAVLALVGFFIPLPKKVIDLVDVKKRLTVCRVLNEKGLLTDSEYKFETEDVASRYDQYIFDGYLFILAPAIRILQKVSHLDGLFIFLVRQWMIAHHGIIENKGPSVPNLVWLSQFCVRIAGCVGRVLMLVRLISRRGES